MSAISIFESHEPRPLNFQLLREARRAAFKNAGGSGDAENPLHADHQPDRIVAHPEQRQRYALLFGSQSCPFTFDGIPIVADETMPRDAMEFRRGDRPFALIQNLVY